MQPIVIKTTKIKTGAVSDDRKRYKTDSKKDKRLQLSAKYSIG